MSIHILKPLPRTITRPIALLVLVAWAATMDFHAYAEVYIGGAWFTTDARFHVPRIGRIKVSCGQDAVDGAFSTIYGGATLTYFQVWAYQVARGSVRVGDPIDLAQRLDNQWTVYTDRPSTTSA